MQVQVQGHTSTYGDVIFPSVLIPQGIAQLAEGTTNYTGPNSEQYYQSQQMDSIDPLVQQYGKNLCASAWPGFSLCIHYYCRFSPRKEHLEPMYATS